MPDEYQETVEDEQATTAIDEEGSSVDEGIEQSIDNEEIQSDIPDAPQGKYVPLEVVESMREQARELKAHNEQLLQLMLSNQRQPQEEQKKEEQFQFADDDFLTGAQLKAVLAQQQERSNQQQQAIQDQQREAYIAEQKQSYMAQYPDYNDVIGAVNAEAQKDPAMAEIIMRTKNPVETAYRYGKLLRGESIGEVKSVKEKVSQENKIKQNLAQARTLSTVKGTAVKTEEDDFDALYNKIKGY